MAGALALRQLRFRRWPCAMLASTNEAVLKIVPLAALRDHAAAIPADPSALEP